MVQEPRAFRAGATIRGAASGAISAVIQTSLCVVATASAVPWRMAAIVQATATILVPAKNAEQRVLRTTNVAPVFVRGAECVDSVESCDQMQVIAVEIP